MSIPKKLLYTKNHAWIKIQDDIAVVGITDDLQEMLQAIEDIDLPFKGDELDMDDECVTLHHGGGMYDLPTPLTGRIVKVNNKLKNNLTVLHTAPYTSGWIFEMEYDELDELDLLLSADEYSEELDLM
ncbi:MAG TPA: glycine cleavage system protein H [Victivallales bacterium]|nr:glycine cleavage system protein H [Victivallales bacterium]